MKEIQPIQIWYNGQFVEAVTLNAIVINDNLINSAIFSWQLLTEIVDEYIPAQIISVGELIINGQDYIDWNSDPDINTAAYNWIAEQLGLTII